MTWTERVLTGSLLGAAACCLAVVLVRTYNVFILNAPSLALTSGCEEESLFAIWRMTRGLPVYIPIEEIPFASAYFNFGFYYTYGSITRLILFFTQAPDIWIPTIARAITVLIAVTGIWSLGRMLKALHIHSTMLKTAAFSCMMAFSPLCGFWIITARPDLAAIILELEALTCFLLFMNSRSNKYWITGVLLCFAAWSFKQTNVGVITGLCVYLLFHKEWLLLAFTCIITWSLYSVTLWLGGETFRFWLLWSQSGLPFYAEQSLLLIKSAFLKFPLAILPFIGVAYLAWKKRLNFLHQIKAPEVLLVTTTVISLVLSILAASKAGAADYYYIMPAILTAICGIYLISNLNFTDTERHLILSIPAMLVLISTLLVITGIKGTLNQSTVHREHYELKQALRHLPSPAFISRRSMNLPWIQTHPPHLVWAFTYPESPADEAHFEAGGIAGLIQNGYFQTLVLFNHLADQYTVPGLYSLKETHEKYKVYLLNRSAKKPECIP
ncbi:MAG: hypothetical protein AAF649_01125 [Verrucomicrobiota bacterium]